jgi:hypothetical protein
MDSASLDAVHPAPDLASPQSVVSVAKESIIEHLAQSLAAMVYADARIEVRL